MNFLTSHFSSLGLLIDWFSNPELIGIWNNKSDGFFLVGITLFILNVTNYGYYWVTLKAEILAYKLSFKLFKIMSSRPENDR